MPRVYHVKKARKDNPVVKAGEPYYHWTLYRSPTQYSRTYPRQSQLCGGRKSEVFAAQENLEESCGMADNFDAVRVACEDCANQFREIGEGYSEGVDNMPENLQYGDQAENMRQMGESLEMAADELDEIDFEPDYEVEDEDGGKLEESDGYLDVLGTMIEEAVGISEQVEVLF